jgi:rare lipoprotein A
MPASRPSPQVQLASATPADIVDAGDPILPALGPIVPERPLVDLAASGVDEMLPILGYADIRVERAARAFDALTGDGGAMTPAEIVASWKRSQPGATGEGDEAEYVAVGTFASVADSSRQAKALSAYGRAEVQTAEAGGRTFYSVNLYPDGRASIDEMLEQAWAHGATDAMTVRD